MSQNLQWNQTALVISEKSAIFFKSHLPIFEALQGRIFVATTLTMTAFRAPRPRRTTSRIIRSRSLLFGARRPSSHFGSPPGRLGHPLPAAAGGTELELRAERPPRGAPPGPRAPPLFVQRTGTRRRRVRRSPFGSVSAGGTRHSMAPLKRSNQKVGGSSWKHPEVTCHRTSETTVGINLESPIFGFYTIFVRFGYFGVIKLFAGSQGCWRLWTKNETVRRSNGAGFRLERGDSLGICRVWSW